MRISQRSRPRSAIQCLHAQILKMPHQGTLTSSTKAMAGMEAAACKLEVWVKTRWADRSSLSPPYALVFRDAANA